MPPTFFGRAVSPADNVSQVAQNITIVPPASMVAGDLVLLIGICHDAFTPAITISNAGGQTWTTMDDVTLHSLSLATRRFWCEYDGTWDANPILNQDGPAVQFSGVMLVARHGPEGLYWAQDHESFSTMTDSVAPLDLSYPAQFLKEVNEVAFVQWASDVIYTMALQTAGWTNPGGDTQYRNPVPPFMAFDTMEETVPSGTDNIGTAITFPGVAHTKSAWVQLIASTSFDADWITILIHQTNSAGVNSSTLLDIGTGAAAAEVVLIPNLQAGYIANFTKEYNFPVHIPAGTRVAARLQGARTTGSGRVAIILHGASGYAGWVAGSVEAIGANLANSQGVSVTATQNAEGTWTSIGAPTVDTQMLALGVSGNGDTGGLTVANFAVDIGTGDPTPTLLQENIAIRTLTQEIGGPYPAFMPLTREIPADETIWLRAQTHVATDLTLDYVVYAMQE